MIANEINFSAELLNNVRGAIQDSQIYEISFTGFQALGISIVGFNFLKTVIESSNPESETGFNFALIATSFSYCFIILASSSIFDTLENFLLTIESGTSLETSVININQLLPEPEIEEELDEYWYETIIRVMSGLVGAIMATIILLFVIVVQAIDTVIYAIFLCERQFILLTLEMLFNLVIALSAIPNLRSLVFKWIGYFIATSLLLPAFVGITNFVNSITEKLIDNVEIHSIDDPEFNIYLLNLAAILIFTVFVKFKLYTKASTLLYQILT